MLVANVRPVLRIRISLWNHVFFLLNLIQLRTGTVFNDMYEEKISSRLILLKLVLLFLSIF